MRICSTKPITYFSVICDEDFVVLNTRQMVMSRMVMFRVLTWRHDCFFKGLEITPARIRAFLPKVKWDSLPSMHITGRTGAGCESKSAVYKALYRLFGGFVADVVAAIDQELCP
ncbi:unnamed protein product [Vicia faba]|uniref:Uncharacterized protein n=1 Tax=Vicia faba TaxID=3906 RepID=A0AAV1A2D3_VICFA|nr:unnamed protein product [Vicia faba]